MLQPRPTKVASQHQIANRLNILCTSLSRTVGNSVGPGLAWFRL